MALNVYGLCGHVASATWHVGEPVPSFPGTHGCTLQADGDELDAILAALRHCATIPCGEPAADERAIKARRELNEIANRTAVLSGNLRQFEMSTSRHCVRSEISATVLSTQQHIETLYGMVQRVCAILLETGL